MNILFVGDLNEYGRSFQRYQTLKSITHHVTGISSAPVPFRPGIDDKPSLISRMLWKLKLPLDPSGANEKVIQTLKKDIFDIVWIEKGNTIYPATLAYIKKVLPHGKLVSLAEDDMYLFHNHSFYYTIGLRYYDVVFTNKARNLSELPSLGAKKTILFKDSYDEKLHRPIALTEEDKRRFGAEVGFIGTFEEDRAMKILYLAKSGIPVTIWGNGWGKWVGRAPHLIIHGKPLYGDDYVKAINATKINLCFLRKMNRDDTTVRSVEIPACGGFMLAERTKAHQERFEEGKEAIFFSSCEELLLLVEKYLKLDRERKIIAQAGRRRCAESGYSHREQIEQMLAEL